MNTLLAGAHAVNLEKIVAYPDQIALFAVTSLPDSHCPSCQQPSTRVHSRYQRQITDLPWEGIKVRLYLSARKFFCLNEACHKRIFCERLPDLVAPWGRRSLRLNEALTLIGFALGGRAAARAATALSFSVSPRTLLRRVRRAAPPPASAVQFLGLDDWAMRKGQRYGTILVDLQEHRAIELLPDRDAATVERWLKDHPGVEVISRDRAPGYIEGAQAGAPEAIQVADRFHLVKNLVEALERLMGRHHALLREAAKQASSRYLPEQALEAGGVADRLLTDRIPSGRRRADLYGRSRGWRGLSRRITRRSWHCGERFCGGGNLSARKAEPGVALLNGS